MAGKVCLYLAEVGKSEAHRVESLFQNVARLCSSLATQLGAKSIIFLSQLATGSKIISSAAN